MIITIEFICCLRSQMTLWYGSRWEADKSQVMLITKQRPQDHLLWIHHLAKFKETVGISPLEKQTKTLMSQRKDFLIQTQPIVHSQS